MSRIRRRSRSTVSGRTPTSKEGASAPFGSSPAQTEHRPRVGISLLGLALLVLLGALAFHWFGLKGGVVGTASQAPSAPIAGYVGAESCAQCHRSEYQRWQRSHHALAMLPPDARSVLGNFNDTAFEQHGRRSAFRRSNGQFIVRTDGSDGRPADYPVRYTFGWYPLQQYLLELPGGRLQALSIAWDSRPASAGGQHWFHLYPGENVDARDPLHWTGPYQNWNFMCADCHSTNVRHNYAADTDRFDTRWSEGNVACEACHGPGSAHIAWADKQRHWWSRWRNADVGRGLVVDFEPTPDPHRRAGILARTALSFEEGAELRICAACHSRRTALTNEFLPAEGYDQHYLAALLSDDLYFVDGQIKDEVYEYNSFRQSKMFARGVSCSDCHDPHSAELRSERAGLCLQCHDVARYDSPAHHHHRSGPGGPAVGCVDCHMPRRTYMVVDPRRDHSFRVPRPDLTERYGVPSPCQQCHRDQPARWAAEQVRGWLGRDATGFQHFAEALQAVRGTSVGAERLLRATLDDPSTPPIVKGSLLADSGPLLHAIPDALRRNLHSPFVAERLGALRATEALPPPARWNAAEHLLGDHERAIRIEAARVLASVGLTAAQHRRLEGPLTELRAAATTYASRPQWRMIAASVAANLGHSAQAIEHFEAALALQPSFAPAYANLADLYRGLDQEDKVREVLERGLRILPTDGALHYAYGLHLVRVGRRSAGLAEIKRAVDLSPEDPVYAYGYAVGLYSANRKPSALEFLTARLSRYPGDRNALFLFAQIAVNAGKAEDFEQRYRESLERLAVDDPRARDLLQSLPAPHGREPRPTRR